MKYQWIYTFLIINLIIGCSKEMQSPEPSFCESLAVSYSNHIIPILESKCSLATCHENGFQWGDFTQYIDLKDKAESGILWIRIGVAKTMPPDRNSDLTASELERIKCWLDEGALNN